MSGNNKPPLGIEPERFWKETRLNGLEKVICARIGTEFEIPIEWLIERNLLLLELSNPLKTE